MKKVGILELCERPATNVWEQFFGLTERKQYVSVTPQAISVWCRRMGHRVHYATYYGLGDPKDKLPNDLDVVFIAAHSSLAPLAYALSLAFRLDGTRTVLGGPHAKSFPRDALRFFDLVVWECDPPLIADIIAGQFPPHNVVSSLKPYDDTPTIAERLPEIAASVFWRGRPFAYTLIPMLSSMGCPYTCNFCTDWNSQYRALPAERLAADLRFAAENLPNVKLFFDDPNFGIRFDETLEIFETIPAGQRSPYLIESSLSNLRRMDRLQRLRDTNCVAVAPGIESWTQYSNKAGVGNADSRSKLNRVVDHIHAIAEYVPYIQTNFILGLDTDEGDEPFELTKEFLVRVPIAFPTLNIPMAFGGTPLFATFLKEGRILRAMPFTFYMVPYLTLVLKNYDPLEYFEKLTGVYAVLVSNQHLKRRLSAGSPLYVKFVNTYRTLVYRRMLEVLQATRRRLQSDRQYYAFHADETEALPEVYAELYTRHLGKYAELIPLNAARPVLDGEPVTPLVPGAAHIPLTAVAAPSQRIPAG